MMFKTRTEVNVSADTLAKTTKFNYRIQPGDKFHFTLYPNKGYQLVDVLTITTAQRIELDYDVRESGYAILPVIDSFKIQGLTVPQAEDKLRVLFGSYFVNPFVNIVMSNRRVSVIRSRSASVTVDLTNENMNLLEVLAKSGGLSDQNKARRIKIVRGDMRHPTIRFIDLSKVSSLSNEDLRVYPNDIIYIDPQESFTAVNNQIVPLLSAITTVILLYDLFKNTKL